MTLLKPIDGSKQIVLRDYDPDDTGGIKKSDAEDLSKSLLDELAELQTYLYAAQETPVLIVLQGMDTAGKDGTIRHVMSSMSPQSCRVASFKIPTPLEAAHDFLWRIHQETPAKGSLTIFNRSHYEDVLVVRVHNLVPPDVWERRYTHINHFESLLADAGMIIVKFCLYISKDEQEKRLLEREKDPLKSWKLSPQDWKERDYWNDYQSAYEDAINRCAAPHAPWYIVPSNKKWYRNLAIARTLVDTLKPHKDGWIKQLKSLGKEELDELKATRQKHGSPS